MTLSRSSTASYLPLLVPLGTLVTTTPPVSNHNVHSIVGNPRESRISRANKPLMVAIITSLRVHVQHRRVLAWFARRNLGAQSRQSSQVQRLTAPSLVELD